jgi:hypothetical protein
MRSVIKRSKKTRSRNERLPKYSITRVVTERKRHLHCGFWFVRHGDEPEYKSANEEHGNAEEDSNQENAAARETLLGLHFRPFLFQDSSRSPGSIVPSLLVSCKKGLNLRWCNLLLFKSRYNFFHKSIIFKSFHLGLL